MMRAWSSWWPSRARRLARPLPSLRKDYAEHPERYWDSRHRAFAGGLRGVGAIGGDEDLNRVDYHAKLAVFSPAVAEAFAAGARTALDAGCGIGVFSECLVEHGYRVTAVDFSPTAVQRVRESVPGIDEVLVADLAELELGETFDVVTCIDVLFHVVDDERWAASVERLAAHTAPHGWLLVQEHLVPPGNGSGVEHVRWRTADDYATALPGFRAVTSERYDLPGEHTWKDLTVWRRTP